MVVAAEAAGAAAAMVVKVVEMAVMVRTVAAAAEMVATAEASVAVAVSRWRCQCLAGPTNLLASHIHSSSFRGTSKLRPLSTLDLRRLVRWRTTPWMRTVRS